ncbi:MAG: FmdE family protein, partial [Methanoregulaceae archaeon]|nr:FmdE family protein [Methanoregulaceae archaeon]
MKALSQTHDFGKLRKNMDAYGLTARLQDHLNKCITFHTHLAPGLVIAVFMVDYALELLDADPGERLHAVAETSKCVPDPLQVITRCTIGNHRLRVMPYGKFAITLNPQSEEPVVDGVRVFVDSEKAGGYSIISSWYTKDPKFNPETMVYPLLDEILKAGRQILSYERVRVKVPKKEKWQAITCNSCGEMIPDTMQVNNI